MSSSVATTPVRFLVEVHGKPELTYHFEKISDAMETLDFIKDFFPNARFIVEPVLN